MTTARLAATVIMLTGACVLAKAHPSSPTTGPAPAVSPVQGPDKPAIRLSGGPNSEINTAWVEFHETLKKNAQAANVDICFIGDSITQGWDGAGRPVWAEKFAPLKAVNFGISGDRTQHVLWRLENGALDGVKPKVVVILIGINNLGENEPQAIAAGIKAVVNAVRVKAPQAKVLLMGIFPMGEKADDPIRAKIKAVNDMLPHLDVDFKLWYADIGERFLSKDGNLSKEIMPDGLHPSAKGYEIWADAILPTITELLAK